METAIPQSTRNSLTLKLIAHQRRHWPQLGQIEVRFRGNFASLDGLFADGYRQPLCRLRYGGSASLWGFAIYLASQDGYQDSILPDGSFEASAEAALDCACLLLPQ